MSIFERTFVITRVLYWLAAGVAAIGLVSALLAWELERARALALLRTLGITPGAPRCWCITQTLFMGSAWRCWPRCRRACSPRWCSRR